ncbi:hypothetical protein DFJ58DRAFT_471519 [Suillus subalutaceus]|uniref:uncharacterized protein n=1 Tax=Suillus subalutaceus TaxID=48586 RepID=UPI001B870516|nr:uncharacterized protein DFJ58DRAFT_471519 [Suillus subalutaceus]KAG1871871.1 hypothetical protein DFJ58DRAFT_471519 [Suillus subalutaceus]
MRYSALHRTDLGPSIPIRTLGVLRVDGRLLDDKILSLMCRIWYLNSATNICLVACYFYIRDVARTLLIVLLRFTMRKGKGKDNSLRNSTQDTETTACASKPLRIFDAVVGEIANVHPYAKMVLGVLSSAAKNILAQVDRDAAIVTGSWDITVRLWDAATGTLVGMPLRGHTDSVNSFSFSPDSTRIDTGSSFKGDHSVLPGEGDVTIAPSNSHHRIYVPFISSHFC